MFPTRTIDLSKGVDAFKECPCCGDSDVKVAVWEDGINWEFSCELELHHPYGDGVIEIEERCEEATRVLVEETLVYKGVLAEPVEGDV